MTDDWDPISKAEYLQERRLERVRRYAAKGRTHRAVELLIKEWSMRGPQEPMRELLFGLLGGEGKKRGRNPADPALLGEWRRNLYLEFLELGVRQPKASREQKLHVLSNRYGLEHSTLERHLTEGKKWLEPPSELEDYSAYDSVQEGGTGSLFAPLDVLQRDQ